MSPDSSVQRTVLVTGGTGALGRAVVHHFLDAGDRVVAPWIEPHERDELAGQHARAFDQGRLVLREADIADENGAALAIQSAGGQVDVLVNAAGGFGGGAPLHESELDLWDRMYRINVRTAVATTRAALPGMIRRRRGVVLFVASQAAPARVPGLAAYCASKDAIIVLTETLQKEVAEHGIRVNAVSPSTIDTPGNRAAMPEADPSEWTPPSRIAVVLRWLASDAAATVRGAVVPV